MANANRPTGLSPVKHITGAPYNGQANLYSIASGYGTALAVGDPVGLSGTADSNGVAGIILGTTGTIVGVIVGLGLLENSLANPSNLDQIIRPASSTGTWYALVADSPDIIFEVQEDSVGGALAATNVGQNASLIAGTNNGFLSGWQLDSSTAAGTDTLQVQLLGLARKVDNAFGTNAKWLVRINNHQYANQVAGV